MNEPKSKPRGEFFAGLSHRVRQPLNGAIEALAQMSQTSRPVLESNLLRLVTGEARDLVSLLNDILDWVRLTEKDLPLWREPFDLTALLAGLRADWLTDPCATDQTRDCLIHPDLPVRVVGDPGRLRQALANILSSLPTEAGVTEMQFAVGSERETDEEVWLRFTFRLRATSAQSVRLRWFFQTATDVSQSAILLADGVSPALLRLTVAHLLMLTMGSRAEAEQETADEFVLRIDLPLAKRSVAAVVAGAESAVVQGRRIGLVIGKSGNDQPVRGWLEGWGCRVRVIGETENMLETLREAGARNESFEAVIFISESNGQIAEDLGRAIRGDEFLRRIPLVLLAIAGRRGDAARLRGIGFAAYLTQPVDPSELYRTLALLATSESSEPAAKRALITRHVLRERMFRQIRVGVIDGNPVQEMLVLRLLEKIGCRARAYSPDAPPETTTVDLLLVDEADAQTVADRWRDAGGARARLVMRSADSQMTPESWMDGGWHGVLTKPVSGDDLRAAVDRGLQTLMAADEPTAWTDRALVDLPALLAHFDQDREVLFDVLTHFIEDSQRQLDDLRRAVESDDKDQALAIAGALGDAAGSLEIGHLPALLVELQRAIEVGQPIGEWVAKAELLLARIGQLIAGK